MLRALWRRLFGPRPPRLCPPHDMTMEFPDGDLNYRFVCIHCKGTTTDIALADAACGKDFRGRLL